MVVYIFRSARDSGPDIVINSCLEFRQTFEITPSRILSSSGHNSFSVSSVTSPGWVDGRALSATPWHICRLHGREDGTMGFEL